MPVTTNTNTPRVGRGYTATLYSILGLEKWVGNAGVISLPDPTGFEGTAQMQSKVARLRGGIVNLGDVAFTVPQDDAVAVGARVSGTAGSLVLQKTGEKTRAYVGHIVKDGGVSIDPTDVNGQRRGIVLACGAREIIITETLPAGVTGSAYTGGITATGVKNDESNTADSFSYALEDGESLPTGLSLNASTGAITGTPSTTTPATAVIKITGSEGIVRLQIAIVITAA